MTNVNQGVHRPLPKFPVEPHKPNANAGVNPDGKGANSQGTLNKPEPPAPPPPPPPPVDPKTVDNFMNAQASLVKGTLSAGSINKPNESNVIVVDADTILKQFQDIREITNKTDGLFTKFDADTQKAIAGIIAKNINNSKELKDVVKTENLEKLFKEITSLTSGEECEIRGKFGDVCEDIMLYIGYLIGLIESGVKGTEVDLDTETIGSAPEEHAQYAGFWGRMREALRIGRDLGRERGQMLQS